MSKSIKTRVARERRNSPEVPTRGGEYERFMALTPAQRAAEVAKFDREDLTSGKPLTAKDKSLHRRAAKRGKMGRPTIGKGSKLVPVTIERGLLEQADSYAKQHGLKRSQMVAQGLLLVMKRAKVR